MNVKNMALAVSLVGCAVAYGQGTDNFVRQQAYAEMQRVSGQIDVLQNNISDLQNRVRGLVGGGEAKGIRQEVEALRAAVADIRLELQNQRREIIKEVSNLITKMQPPAPPPKPVEKTVVIAPHQEYVVQSGDNLTLIAQAFGTTVAKIKEMNNLKGDSLRVGQKLMLPK